MTNSKAFFGRHSVLFYYILAFGISWGGILIAVGRSGIPGTPEQVQRLLPLAILAMLTGPSFAGLLMTGLVHGRAGYRELLFRLLRWRVGARWYAVALLTAPLLMMAIPLAVSLLFPRFLPRIFAADDRTSILLMGIVAGLAAGVFEEIGWTGFATPELRRHHTVLATGLIVGFLWGGWHLLVNIWSSGTASGTLSPALFLHSVIFSAGILPAYRVLMVWVYERTDGSLLVAMLMHASLTGSNVLFVPLSVAGVIGPAWSLVLALALWVIVVAIAAADRRQVSSAPLQGATV